MAEITIRPFAEADLLALRELFLLTRDATFTWAAGTHRLDDFERATKDEIILVACIDGVVAGFASVWEPESFVHNLFVHPDYQGRGVGKALLAACAGVYHRAPTLKCQQRNLRALEFYRRQGWRFVSTGNDGDGEYCLLQGPWPPES